MLAARVHARGHLLPVCSLLETATSTTTPLESPRPLPRAFPLLGSLSRSDPSAPSPPLAATTSPATPRSITEPSRTAMNQSLSTLMSASAGAAHHRH